MKITPIKISFFKTSSFITKKQGNYNVPYDIVSFKAQRKNHESELGKIFAEEKDFPKFLIPDIIKSTNKKNVNSRLEAYNFLKSQKGRLKKDYVYALSSLIYTEPDNLELLKMMARRKNFPKSIMWSVLISANKENQDTAEMMIKDPDFPKDKISSILFRINKDNKEIAKSLIRKKDFPREDIGLVLSNVNDINAELCQYMLSECDYITSEIVEVLQMYPKES